MTIAIMQPYFFPYLGYWQLLNAVDKFIILDDVTFIKQGYINRNTILSHGKVQKINLQVEAISSNKLILDHNLNKNSIWKSKLLKMIYQSYSKAKYFKNVFPLIEKCILFNADNLSSYLENQIVQIASFLNIDTAISRNSEVINENDFESQNRIINICSRELADVYLNASGGQELYNKEVFKRNGIKLKFIKMNDIQYTQFTNEFLPFLSIIDVMMFNSEEKIKKMLDNYTLI